MPAFAGLGAPHWDMYARGTIVGITRGTTAAHITRATLESIALQTLDVVELMERETGVRMPELRVDGGAVANDLLMQIQADVLQRPVVRRATAGDDGARRGVPRRARRRVLEGRGRDRAASGARAARFEPTMPRVRARRARRRLAARRRAREGLGGGGRSLRPTLADVAKQKFDVVVIGGGINGAGIAREAQRCTATGRCSSSGTTSAPARRRARRA